MGRTVIRRNGWTGEKPARERAIFPLEICEFRSFEAEFDYPKSGGLTSKRSFAPYQPGDVVLARDGVIKVVRIMRVFAERLTSSGDLIPKYRVQHLTKDFHWSNQWTYVWPGYIFHGYHDANKRPVYRPTFLLESFVEELK